MSAYSDTNDKDQPSEAELKKRFMNVVREFKVAILITRGAGEEDDVLGARPMSVVEVTDQGEIYFVTSIAGHVATAIEADPRVEVVLQSRTRYAVASGRATVSQERDLIDELWTDAWKVWFPKGKEDPEIAIVTVDLHRGEYWDESGAKGLAFLFRAARAYAKGDKIDITAKEHGKVDLH